jgi:starvation-inducible DNA-binding protein
MITQDESMKSVADALMPVLANATIMYHRAHGFHWNVVDPDFPQWHDKFAEIYEDVYGSLDPFAENIRKMGSVAPFCLWDLSEHATVDDENAANFSARTLVEDLLATNTGVIVSLNAAFRVASSANQQGIANFIAERLDAHQKWNWQLQASL